MPLEKGQQQALAEFYVQAQEALEKLAEAHGLEAPKGAATIESGCLHWRLSVYTQTALGYWKRQWEENAAALDLPSTISPGDKVIDQMGSEWTLLGLDPTGGSLPVRLEESPGKESFVSVAQAQLMQRVA